MKKLIIIISLFTFCLSLQAQQVKPDVINSMGGSTTYGGGYLAFNVGEPIVGTQSGSSVTLSQGFLQTWQMLAKQLIVKVFLEGLFYDGNGNIIPGGIMHPVMDGNTAAPVFGSNIADTITIELRDHANYDTLVARFTGLDLLTNGNINISNISAMLNESYYITPIHRFSVPVTSAQPVSFVSDTIQYDFTTASNKAYGSNAQKEITPNVYGLYAGEQNRDSFYLIDGSDLGVIEPYVNLGIVGYVVSDLDGNGWVDGSDLVVLEGNLNLGPYFQNPLTAKKKMYQNFSTE